jgi:hypothetical protein
MSRYAENTSVSVESSRGEIERTLQRYGAASFAYGWDQERAVIEFHHQDRKIRFVLPLPDRSAREFTHTPGRHNRRSEADAYKAWEQACRQRWRALALAIKAKLEAVEAGITTFEDEFMAHIVLPDGSTFGRWARPQIAKVYEENTMPTLLALGTGEDG